MPTRNKETKKLADKEEPSGFRNISNDSNNEEYIHKNDESGDELGLDDYEKLAKVLKVHFLTN